MINNIPLKKTIVHMPEKLATQIANELLNQTEKHNIDDKSYQIKLLTAKFDDGKEMDISVNYRKIDKMPRWIEATIFDKPEIHDVNYKTIGTKTYTEFQTTYEISTQDARYLVQIELDKEINIFFDMDDVLSILEGDVGFANKGYRLIDTKPHYFRDLKPNPHTQKLIKRLTKIPNVNLYVLSHTTEHDKKRAAENLYDKQIWLRKHYSSFSNENIIMIPNQTVPKWEAIALIYDRSINKNDILIDDYNKNLEAWEAAGGTAVKYLNGKNSPLSFNGMKIPYTKSIEDCICKLTEIKPYETDTKQSLVKRIIILQNEYGTTVDVMLVNNYNNDFSDIFQICLGEWHTSQEEFTTYMYKQLQKYGYDIQFIDYDIESAALS